MDAELKPVARRFAAFIAFFFVVVLALWAFGEGFFTALLKQSRAYIPPQFLTWLSLISSLSAAIAFCVMPFLLFRIVRKRSDVPFGWVVLCLAGFLFLTGVTSLFGLLNIWFHGPLAIWTLVIIHVGSALLAVGTLLILWALVPRILEIPSRAQWLALEKDFLRAEARAEEKDKLLAVVSHELRTPLAPLLASLTELEQRTRQLGDGQITDCIEVLRSNVEREASLINALLDRFEIPGPAGTQSDRGNVTSASAGALSRRLLLVEDHADTLRVFARLLRREGFDVVEATTVSAALAAARPGDFLISDIALPDGDGCDLMRRLSSLGIIGIAISGFGTAKDRERYRTAGFAEFFVKPIDVKDVVSAVSRVLSQTNAICAG